MVRIYKIQGLIKLPDLLKRITTISKTSLTSLDFLINLRIKFSYLTTCIAFILNKKTGRDTTKKKSFNLFDTLEKIEKG